MLNTPNEWHNEDDIEEYTDEDFSDDYGSDYGEDADFGTLDDGEYEDGEYGEDVEEGEEDGGDDNGGSDDDLKKKIIIGAVVVLIIILLFGGIFLVVKKMTQKASTATNVESVVGTDEEVAIGEEGADGEVSIDVDDGTSDSEVAIEESGEDVLGVGAEAPKPDVTTEGGGLEIEVDEGAPTFADKPNDVNNVTVSIGDVGRKNPFAPVGGTKSQQSSGFKQAGDGLDFEIIEPPELEPEDEMITKLLETKVTGIMYDAKRPSAIVNIDGVDQLVRIGDILSGFEFISITRNKVVIRSDDNIYRASVGQPLNAEKITNPIEISNLETKFKGSVRRR